MENITLQQHAQLALTKAVNAIIQQQHSDGHWDGCNFAGPMFTAMLMITEQYLGIHDPQDAEQAAQYMRATQLDDGSFPDYPMANSGSLDTSAMVYAGLKCCGVATTDPRMQQAEQYIQQQGGFAKVNILCQVYLIMAGLYSADHLQNQSLLFKLIPGNERILGSRFGLEMVQVANQLPVIIYGLKNQGAQPSPWRHPFLCLERAQVLRYLQQRQNPAGNWAGILMATLFSLLCYHFLGVRQTDPAYQSAVDYLQHWKVYTEQGLQVVPYMSEIWNTALMTRALLMANKQHQYDEAIKKGLDYLLQHQSNLPEPIDWQNPKAGAPRTGGWPYEQDNPLCCDCDTTGAVLWTLGLAQQNFNSPALQQAIQQGLAWELGMQNKDGGWAAFAHGLKSKPPGAIMTSLFDFPKPSILTMIKLFFNPPLVLGDPATAGLTGRVLSGLGLYDFPQRTDVLLQALEFLEYQRDSNHAWWGRWEVNYLMASSCVINGLKQIGHDMQSPLVRHAIEWMLSKQNADGGWGESPDSYYHPDQAGEGPSQAAITAAVLSALLDVEGIDEAVLQSGLRYLLHCQNTQGLWDENQVFYVMIPPNTFYTNFIYSQYSPMEVLSKYLQRHSAS